MILWVEWQKATQYLDLVTSQRADCALRANKDSSKQGFYNDEEFNFQASWKVDHWLLSQDENKLSNNIVIHLENGRCHPKRAGESVI